MKHAIVYKKQLLEIINEANDIVEDEDGEDRLFDFVLWLSEIEIDQ